MSVRATVTGLLCLGLLACPKKDNADPKSEADAGAAPVASAPASAGPTAAAKGGAFAGKYVVSAGTMYVPAEKDWASVKFKNDESKLLGAGDLTLTIDAGGRASGASEGGPLGAAILEGSSDGQVLSATIRRKDPSDDGLTGTLTATISGDKLEGTMKLAEFNAAVVRTATFTATKK